MNDMPIIRYRKHSEKCPSQNGEKPLMYFYDVRHNAGRNGRGRGWTDFLILRCNYPDCPGEVLVNINEICTAVEETMTRE